MSFDLFKEELANVAAKIAFLLEHDTYPNAITPDYLRDLVRDYPTRAGKRLRPALLLWSCGIAGGKIENAEFAAAAVEIYHNWTLVHDDIIDNDNMRRGLPTAHWKIAKFAKEKFGCSEKEALDFGRNMAILAGDIQHGWAMQMLLKSSERLDSKLCSALAIKMQELVTRELISGEALDVEFALKNRKLPTLEEIEKMYYLKTGALLRFCAEAGAMIGTWNNSMSSFDCDLVSKLGLFAAKCGFAFQLKDDWLGIYGDANALGKPLGSDLVERKPTVILVKTLEKASEKQKKKMLSLMEQKEISLSDIETARKIISECGAETEVLSMSKQARGEAISILKNFQSSKYRDLLIDWADYILERNK